MRRFLFVASTVVVAVAFAVTLGLWATTPHQAKAAAGSIAYVPIDPHVFVPKKTVAGWVAVHNEAAVRNHAAMLWAGLTQRTTQQLRGTRLAVFDTWFTPCDVYPYDTNCGSVIIRTPLNLEIPEQFFRTPRLLATNIFSSVRYNLPMKRFVDIGFDGKPYTTGAGLLAAMAAKQTDLVDTAASQSMALKPVYELLSKTQPTVITYWGGPALNVALGASTSPNTPGPDTWLKAALIDPTGKARNDKPVTFCANTYDPTGTLVGYRTYTAPAKSYDVIPLSQFYSIPLAPADEARIAQLRANYHTKQFARLTATYGTHAVSHAMTGCPEVTPPNPVAALVAMHVVSAELQDVWTWQTFWWQPDVKPLPGSIGPFAHFDVAEAYWTIDKPPYTFHYAFNPYLEAEFGTLTFLTNAWPKARDAGSVINLGRTTDCISCHSQATYTVQATPSPSPGYVAHGNQPQLSLPQSILARNLWSLAIRAGHPSPAPARR